MKELEEKLRTFFETRGYEVCSRLGERLGIQASKIRFFFIYASFMTLGSPLIVYFAIAFMLRIKDYINGHKTSVFDL